MDPRTDLLGALKVGQLPLDVAILRGDERLDATIRTDSQRDAVLKHLSPYLRFKGKLPMNISTTDGASVVPGKDCVLASVYPFRRDGNAALIAALAREGEVSGVTVVKTANTEAMEDLHVI